jgi:hypothetical protein
MAVNTLNEQDCEPDFHSAAVTVAHANVPQLRLNLEREPKTDRPLIKLPPPGSVNLDWPKYDFPVFTLPLQ